MRFEYANSQAAAFTTVYENTHQKLYAVFIHICGDKELTKDILQKTYQVLWEKWDTLQDRDDLFPFLLTVARNTFFDHHRRSSRYKQIVKSLQLRTTEQSPAADLDYARKECRQTISSLMTRLPAKRKQAMELYLEAGLSRVEIAEEMNISPNTVDNQLQKALHFLRREMRGYAGEKLEQC